MDHPLTTLRADFDAQAGRSLALPLAGAIVWAVIGLAALLLPQRPATLLLLFGSGAIFPLGLALAALLRERLLDNTNPLAKLMGLCVLMVNLLWALHLTLLSRDPALLPLSLGIGLGLHWIVFSWIIQHPLGIVHTVLRTVLATGLWWLFPVHPITAVAAAVVLAYLYSIVALATRRRNNQPAGQAQPV
ncbi:DUF7010 family protein [Candidatus Chloroploca asiatica]|uniref:Uncharacterized protein n=1 Tax=Candidatus Chloroploca asiatica TaxID=1506545 RepID=A0A2H3LA02_9CHLR|nr:hypothetical protein [Candidatus Chloroploca asiatica]PDW00235.1 hypothetical protein A9Q02_10470 [Candidatus Chloroploca asiatica]